VKFKDGESMPADLVCMAAGIRPNVALAEKAGIHCNRGIVVNDTLQTYDPRIYAVGECANHRGTAYGLVAPLFEQAKVCANHLAMYGIGRYQGSVTSTKLKVTGIDVFSAGDFSGSDGTEDIVLHDPGAGIYKRLVLKDDKLVGAVLYGDTKDGAWYFQLLKDGQDIHDIRDNLVFGNAHLGDVGHKGNSLAAGMPDSAEVCGCNGVCKGTIVKAIKEQGLFTLEDVRKHTKASSSCGSCTGLVEQILASTIGGAYQPADSTNKPVCGCTDHSHGEVRRAIREHKLLSVAEAQQFLDWKTPNGCASCRPALNYYCISSWPHEAMDDPRAASSTSAPTPTSRRTAPTRWCRACGAASPPRRAARHRRRRREIQGAHRQGHRRPAHRPARREEGRPARHVGRFRQGRHGLGPRLRQEPAHREDLRGFRALPLRHPALDGPGRQAREDAVRHVEPPQVQAGRVGLPAQLRRVGHQGHRRDRRRFGLRALRRRQRRHQDRGGPVLLQGEGRRRGARIRRRLHPALPRGGLLPGAHLPLPRAGRPGARQKAVLEDAEQRKALYERLLFALQNYKDPWAEIVEDQAGGIHKRQFEIIKV
jgi:bacterioferritin-associated ferredoxin